MEIDFKVSLPKAPLGMSSPATERAQGTKGNNKVGKIGGIVLR